MQQQLLLDGILLTSAYYCIHRARRKLDLLPRKPKPGLLVKAAADFQIDLRHSIFIGDSETDAQAAQAAGCKPVLFGSGLEAAAFGTRDWPEDLAHSPSAAELFDVVARCLPARR